MVDRRLEGLWPGERCWVAVSISVTAPGWLADLLLIGVGHSGGAGAGAVDVVVVVVVAAAGVGAGTGACSAEAVSAMASAPAKSPIAAVASNQRSRRCVVLISLRAFD